MNSIAKIHSFWKEKARVFRSNQEASWADILVTREINVLSEFLQDGDRVLDVGCASGFSSLQFAQRKRISLLGIDYVKEMVQSAKDALKKLPKDVQERVTFKEGNAMKLTVPKNAFDIVISTRCLCNLTSWKEQETAIVEMWKALKPDGRLLLSEPTIEGLAEINKVGKTFGLKALSAPWHNLYLDETKLLAFAPKYFSVKVDYFSSTYYLFSRVLYRWFVHDDVTKLKRNSIFNKLGISLPSVGTWGVQRLYILTKKS